MPIDGVVNLFKPTNLTSARYVYRLRALLGEKRVGHAGSLDPFADGVLLGCVGKGTKLVERLMGLPKEYEAIMRLGVTNACFDPELPYETVTDAAMPPLPQVQTALAQFVGLIEQEPPAYSAVKVGGRAAHHRAREGQQVKLAPRPVRIDKLELLAYEWPLLRVRVTCGRGVYIRALARDIGSTLLCGAVCEELRRTRVGPFTADQAILLRQVDPHEVRAAVMGLEQLEQMLVEPLR